MEGSIGSRPVRGHRVDAAIWLAVLAVSLVLKTESSAAEFHRARCYMGSCSWFREISRDLAGSSTAGALFRVTLLGGHSPDRRRPPIRWNVTPHHAFVFCSKKFPLTAVEQGNALQIDALNFSQGVPGALDSSALLYMWVCHSVDAAYPAPELGYEVDPRIDEIGSQIKVPFDILKLQ